MLTEHRKQQIEDKAMEVLNHVYLRQDELSPNKQMSRLEMINPELICRAYDIEFDRFDIRSIFNRKKGQMIEGIFDGQSGRILISDSLRFDIERFTIAHELGHYFLHDRSIMYRDRAIDGVQLLNENKDYKEYEADYFAACLLMPKKLFLYYFSLLFRVKIPLQFTENLAFNLKPNDYYELLEADSTSLVRELAIAKCSVFDMQPQSSLVEIFRVSPTAAARRLKDLKVIGWP